MPLNAVQFLPKPALVCVVVALAGLTASACFGQGLTQRIANHQSDEWHHMVEEKNWSRANGMCNALTHAPALPSRIEAEKCLATVALDSGETSTLAAGDTTGHAVVMIYAPASVDESLVHWNRAIAMAPQDLSVHVARMHVLAVAGRYKEMTPALEDSALKYKGADALGSWLTFDNDLYKANQLRAALSFAEALNKHYPNSLPVELNLARFHNELKEPAQALPFLQTALQASPADPVVTWELGETYNQMSQTTLAEQYMTKAVTMDARGDGVPDRNCLYAEFVEKKLNDKVRACTLQKESCPFERQTSCKVPTPVVKTTAKRPAH